MLFYEYLDVINVNLILKRINNQPARWIAQIEHSDISIRGILKCEYGAGETIEQAVKNYLELIKGKKLILHAYIKKQRREFMIPEDLTL